MFKAQEAKSGAPINSPDGEDQSGVLSNAAHRSRLLLGLWPAMLVTQGVLQPLCDFGALSDNGLVMARLADEKAFNGEGVDKHAMIVSNFDNLPQLKRQLVALMWEVARRYNETYRNCPGGRFQFECYLDYRMDSLEFAQQVLREVSPKLTSFVLTCVTVVQQ
jgi:hypothetical protein